jgi:hypothetical protein
MFFQEKTGEFLADQHRHIFPLRESYQFLPTLTLKHSSIRCFRPLRPPFLKRSSLAFHGIPPSCVNYRSYPTRTTTLPENRQRRNGNTPCLPALLDPFLAVE